MRADTKKKMAIYLNKNKKLDLIEKIKNEM